MAYPHRPVFISLQRACRATAAGMAFALASATVAAVEPETLQLFSDFSPPFTEVNKDQNKGYATIPVRAIVKQAGYQANVTALSWKGALDALHAKPRALIFPIARTPEREDRFSWIGRIGRMQFFVYKLHGSHIAAPAGLEDLKQYRVAAVRKDVREAFLLARGFKEGVDSGLVGVSDNAEALQLLRVGRADIGVFSPVSLAQLCADQRLDCSQFDMIMPLGLTIDLYLAGNVLMPEDEATRLRAAYKTLKEDGTLKRITPPAFYGDEKPAQAAQQHK